MFQTKIKTAPRRLACSVIILVFSAVLPPFAQAAAYSALDVPYEEISSDVSLRRTLVDSWFSLPVSSLLQKQAQIYTLNTGESVEVRVERSNTDVLVVISRERNGLYPGTIQGSWILYRNLVDGSPKKIRLYLRSDPYVYVEFRPLSQKKSVLDVVAYSGYIVYAQPIPFAFQDLYTMPVNQVLSSVQDVFPREYFDVDPRLYRDMRYFVSLVRNKLKDLEYADDGALDEQGRPVYIASQLPQNSQWGLNCSGFAKWIIDGLVRPVTGKGLLIDELKQPVAGRGSQFTEPLESVLDPFFGLDWTRNLALQANRILLSSSYAAMQEIEVTETPISQLIIKKGKQTERISFPSYLKNAGFTIEGLPSLMYSLAVRYPQWFYLASVNTDLPVNLRQYPSGTQLPPAPGSGIRRHFHVAVLVPYFTEEGVFKVNVFESAAETSFDAFVHRYPGYQIHLVRIPFLGSFDPPMVSP